MRWVPRVQRTKVALAVVGLLALGGVVGSAALNDDGGGGDGSEALSVAPGGGPAGARVVAGGGSAGAFTAADDLGVSGSPVPVPEASGGGQAASVDALSMGDGDAAVGGESFGQALPPVDPGRVVKTASLQIEVSKDGFDRAQDQALQAVTDAGGFVQTSSISPTQATLTLRVPADRFEAALRQLRKVGEVKDETVTGQDVTEEFVDLEARLRHWQAQEVAFLDLLSEAGSVAETVEIRRELSTIQQTIEQLQGRIRFLDDQTGFSTITLEMAVPGAVARPPGDGRPSLSEAWETAWDTAVNVVGGTIIVLGALVPLGVMVLALVLVVLALRRRRPPAPAAAA